MALADGTAMAGKVVSVEGRVLMRQDGSAGGALNGLKPGDVVKEGDVINTSSNGKVKLLLEDHTILDLGPSALFKVQKFQVNHGGDRQVDMQMAYGSVRASVSKPVNTAAGGKFQIRTRTATMGVRGTEFIVQSEMGAISRKEEAAQAKERGGKDGKSAPKAPETKVTVVQGKVEVAVPKQADGPKGEARKLASASAPVMLTAGTQLTASLNAPVSKPVTLTQTEMANVTSSVKVNDNTFQKAINLDMGSGSGGGSQSGSAGGSGSGSGGAGAATLAAITAAVSLTVTSQAVNPIVLPPPVPMNTAPRPVFVPVGGLKHVHIVVTR
jgi:hypothetical protein